jgi:hypothetical protein
MKLVKIKKRSASYRSTVGVSSLKGVTEAIDKMWADQLGPKSSFKVKVLVKKDGMYVVGKPTASKSAARGQRGLNRAQSTANNERHMKAKSLVFADRSGGLKSAESVETTQAIARNLNENLRRNKDFYQNLMRQIEH